MSIEQFINAIIDREEIDDDDDYYYDEDEDGNMPCDYSGVCGGTSCPMYWRCNGK